MVVERLKLWTTRSVKGTERALVKAMMCDS